MGEAVLGGGGIEGKAVLGEAVLWGGGIWRRRYWGEVVLGGGGGDDCSRSDNKDCSRTLG